MSAPFCRVAAESPRVRFVDTFHDLVTTRFADGVNALCWQRSLEGDFNEVVQHLTAANDLANVDDVTLRSLPLSDRGKAAVEILIRDQQRLRQLGLDPLLNCIRQYPRDDDGGPVRTDVYSFHADSATVETDTYLCSYTAAASEGVSNEEVRRCVVDPVTRAELLKACGGEDDAEFLEYLRAHCYDLHYVALPDARPFSFGLGNLWRIAVDYPGSPVPPCVHRAPKTNPGDLPRLLLIS